MVVMMLTEDFANHCVVDFKLLKWTMMTIPVFSTFRMLFCFVSSDRSSYSDDGLLHIQATVSDFHLVH